MPIKIPYKGETQIARIKIRRAALVSKVIVKDLQSLNVPVQDTQRAVVQTSNKTIVRKVMVGKPVRRVTATSGVGIGNISGIDISGGLEDGDVLVYDGAKSNFEPTRQLEKQFINGGHY